MVSPRLSSVIVFTVVAGCAGYGAGQAWVNELPEERRPPQHADDGWKEGAAATPRPGNITAQPAAVASGETIEVRDFPDGVPRAVVAEEPADNVFRNTYYDFPREGAGAKDAAVFDASCAEIAKVTREFH